MKTLLLIWLLAIGNCFAGPFFFGQHGAVASSSAAPAVFNPADYGTVFTWIAARKQTGLSDGDAVTTATDSSGTNNFGQATASKKPTYKTGILNGLPSFRFDGVDDWLTNDVSWSPSGQTVFVVVVPSDVSGGNKRFYSQKIVAQPDFLGIGHLIPAIQNAGTWGAFYGGTYRSTYTITTNAAVLETVIDAAGTVQTFYNGTASSSYSGSAWAPTFVQQFIGGSSAGGSEGNPGDYCEVIIYNGNLSSSARSGVRTNLASLYNISVTP